jgi:hypothetical protein
MAAFGVNAYGFMDPGPAYKYTPCWIPPEEGTPTVKILSSKAFEFQKEFKKRYPEYTLSFDTCGILSQISGPIIEGDISQDILVERIKPLFTKFEELFGIGTECLQYKIK